MTNFELTRRPINFNKSDVKLVLPEYYRETYPTLINFIEIYYRFLEEDEVMAFARTIYELMKTRDIEETSLSLLDELLKEIGMGLAASKFFLDPRGAARLLAFLYRLKGSLFSTEMFFKLFFNVDAEVSYPKRNIFFTNQSTIGVDGLSVIQNGQLYQIYSILIKSEIPIKEWRDLYTMFVHPAGFYLGSEVQLIDVAYLFLDSMPNATPLDSGELGEYNYIDFAQMAVRGDDEAFLLLDSFGEDTYLIKSQFHDTISGYSNVTSLNAFDSTYGNLHYLTTYNSPTFDNNKIKWSSSVETFDEVVIQALDIAEGVYAAHKYWKLVMSTGFQVDGPALQELEFYTPTGAEVIGDATITSDAENAANDPTFLTNGNLTAGNGWQAATTTNAEYNIKLEFPRAVKCNNLRIHSYTSVPSRTALGYAVYYSDTGNDSDYTFGFYGFLKDNSSVTPMWNNILAPNALDIRPLTPTKKVGIFVEKSYNNIQTYIREIRVFNKTRTEGPNITNAVAGHGLSWFATGSTSRQNSLYSGQNAWDENFSTYWLSMATTNARNHSDMVVWESTGEFVSKSAIVYPHGTSITNRPTKFYMVIGDSSTFIPVAYYENLSPTGTNIGQWASYEESSYTIV